MLSEPDSLLAPVMAIARKAGDAIVAFRQQGPLEVSIKSNKTPVTKADYLANDLIVEHLQQLNDWPILSEEGEIPSFSIREQWSRYWLSDPLDGTRGFIHGLDEFTVNIALVDQHSPILGVIYAPMYQTLFYASRNQGAFIQVGGETSRPIVTACPAFDRLRFVVGKYHKVKRLQPMLDAIPNASLLRLNSSLKFVAIAEGKADVYIRFGPIQEWDTAAGQCILEEAGGKVVDFNGESLQYNARKSLLCPPFLAVGDPSHIRSLIELFEKGENNA